MYYITKREIERTDTRALYEVLTIYQDEWIGGWLELELLVQSDKINVLSMYPTDYMHYPREERPIVDIDNASALAFPSYQRIPVVDDEGRLLPIEDWERPGIMKGWEILFDYEESEYFGFVMEHLDPAYEYYLFFNILDIYGNMSSSNTVRITLDR